jgi:hypothetical protein
MEALLRTLKTVADVKKSPYDVYSFTALVVSNEAQLNSYSQTNLVLRAVTNFLVSDSFVYEPQRVKSLLADLREIGDAHQELGSLWALLRNKKGDHVC